MTRRQFKTAHAGFTRQPGTDECSAALVAVRSTKQRFPDVRGMNGHVMRHLRSLCCLVVCACTLAATSLRAAEVEPASVEFNRHIRPILSQKCTHCHGPDQATREADLRLDQEQDVLLDRGGYRVVVPGNAAESELLQRITSRDPAHRMPPADSGLQLSAQEIERIKRWIQQGAKYEMHWSFIPPTRPALPRVKRTGWPRNAIDYFVLARLERAGIEPSPEAQRQTLLRRVTLGLTGLPPTLAELDALLCDPTHSAYETTVGRLLNSPHYGEHRARYWLDAARYADTNGYFTDNERSMWRWRDGVVDAFNSGMPFDQFTIEQLAGDLLPQPTLAQQIATGFNRNHMVTFETGVIDEEYRVEYVVDRLHTTATVWMGLTVGCARCHEHKFDPISQEEFYRLFAFFNTTPEKGTAGRLGNAVPVIQVPSSELLARIDRQERLAQTADERLQQLESELQHAQDKWAARALRDSPAAPTSGLEACYSLDGPLAKFSGDDQHLQAVGAVEFTDGVLGRAARMDGDSVLESTGAFDFGRTDEFSYGAWINPDRSGPICVLSKNDDLSSLRGFDLMLRKGKVVAHLIHKWNSNAIQVTTKASVATKRWQHVMVTYDGSSSAAGVKIYVDGKPQEVVVRYDRLTGTIRTEQPFRIGRRSTSAPYVGLIDDVRVYRRALSGVEVRQLAAGQLVRSIVGTPAEKRTAQQKQTLREHYIAEHASERHRAAWTQAREIRQELNELQASIPTTMVMQEMQQPRETYLLVRGQYDAPGKRVTASVLSGMPPLPESEAANRLGMARWLVDPSHPLTARVTVNRLWQQLFGTGIVRTVEDFGTQGDWPSHPDLLDWLAVELIESGWDLKHIQRLIVASATYRQTSRVKKGRVKKGTDHFSAKDLPVADPENRLLGRGPRFRLEAEAVRDNALAISGLLTKRLGGPSVKPYQPKGLWEAVSYDGSVVYTADVGAALYRRSLYTYWKRQSPPPSMLAFDAPTRETCSVRRPRTNTPLQALVLMNDPTYVEAARVLAERMMIEVTGAPAERVSFAFRLATSRFPEPDELQLLLEVYHGQLTQYREDEDAALKLLAVGASRRIQSLDAAEHGAWTAVASIILNMDEVITKH